MTIADGRRNQAPAPSAAAARSCAATRSTLQPSRLECPPYGRFCPVHAWPVLRCPPRLEMAGMSYAVGRCRCARDLERWARTRRRTPDGRRWCVRRSSPGLTSVVLSSLNLDALAVFFLCTLGYYLMFARLYLARIVVHGNEIHGMCTAPYLAFYSIQRWGEFAWWDPTTANGWLHHSEAERGAGMSNPARQVAVLTNFRPALGGDGPDTTRLSAGARPRRR